LHHSSLSTETSAVPTLKVAVQCREMASPIDKAAQARARWDKTRNLLLPNSVQIPERVTISRGKEFETPRFNWPSIDSIKLLNIAAGIIALIAPSVQFAGAPPLAGPPHPLHGGQVRRQHLPHHTVHSLCHCVCPVANLV